MVFTIKKRGSKCTAPAGHLSSRMLYPYEPDVFRIMLLGFLAYPYGAADAVTPGAGNRGKYRILLPPS
jgi:hypothetical protein